jgi:glutathione S-transferase
LAPYTIPAIGLHSGKSTTYIMESSAIAQELEKLYPSPSLHLDSPYIPRVKESVGSILGPLAALAFSRLVANVLAPPSAEYFERTRCSRYKVESLAKWAEDSGEEASFAKARPAIEEMAKMLKENGEGPFFMGQTRSYADIIAVTALSMFKRIDERIFEKVVSVDPVLRKLFDEWAPYLERLN